VGYGPYNKTNDIGHPEWQGVRHENLYPKTSGAIEKWLDDTGAIPDAEVYRYLDGELFQDILREAADRIQLDVRGDTYEVSEATEMYLRRQSMGRLGSYAVMITEGERRVMATTVDPAA
jgi:hypothetical protein